MRNISKYIFLLFLFSQKVLGLAPKYFEFARSIRTNARLDSFHKPEYILSQINITAPGVYIMPDDVIFDPQSDNEAYIIIDSDNVIVDLNLRSIAQKIDNNKNGICGIKVMPGHNNIIIRNGSINGMTAYGILVQDSCEVLDLHDLVILYCGLGGIFLDGYSVDTAICNTLFLNITINEFRNSTGDPVCGIRGQFCHIMNMDNIATGNTGSSSSNIYGVKLENCENVRFKSCVASKNISTGLSTVGFDVDFGKSVLFYDCAASDNSYTGTIINSIAAGFHISNSTEVFLEGCTSVGNISTFTAVGLYLENSKYSGALESQFLSNRSSYTNSHGVILSGGSSNLISKCHIAANNSGVNAFGIKIESESASAIMDCQIQADLALTGTSYGIFMDNSNYIFLTKNNILGHSGALGGFGILDKLGSASTATLIANFCGKNIFNFSPGSPTWLIYGGPLTSNPSIFENVSL